MREIKFRAWDKEKNLMYWWAIPEKPDGHITTHEFLRGNVDIMQYTGLKNKNGKEIYEGDIVESHTSMPLTLCTHPKDYMEIVFDCGYFGVRDLGTSKGKIVNVCMVQPDDWLDLEIIGNIYENPELLAYSQKA